jgi:hypothetical protein
MFDGWISIVGFGAPVAALLAVMLIYAVVWMMGRAVVAYLPKIPNVVRLFLLSCTVGLFGIWINYRLLPEQSFTLLTVTISAAVFFFWTFIVGAFSLEAGQTNADLAGLLVGAPLAAILGGIYLLSGTDILIFAPLDAFLMFVVAHTPLILAGSLVGLVLLVIVHDVTHRTRTA